MIKTKRIKQVQDYIMANQTVSLDELCAVFRVSKNTIRRDVRMLLESEEIRKVYGGVAVNDASPLVSFGEREARNEQAKRAIARAAAAFVDDGDVVFVDSGTTTLQMVEYLKHRSVTVVTNNLDIIVRARPYKNLNVIAIGGMLDRDTNSFVSAGLQLLTAYNMNKAFMASTGVSLANGVTNASPLESEIKAAAVDKSSQVFLLADHQKFDKHGLMTYCSLDRIDCLITDQAPDARYQDYCRQQGIELIIAE